jgi:hypothetical protein
VTLIGRRNGARLVQPAERSNLNPTIAATESSLRNRVNIDTGAFATARLTCLVIEDGRGRFLFTA